MVTAIDEERLKYLLKLRKWVGGTKRLPEELRLEVHRLLKQQRRFEKAAVAEARPAAARPEPIVRQQPAVLPLPQPAVPPAAEGEDDDFESRAATIGVKYGRLPPDRFDADSVERLGKITNFAYEHGRAGVPTADKAVRPPAAARRHREAFRDMRDSLPRTYETNQDVVFIMIGSGRGGTFAAARKLLYELEFTGNRVLALHIDKDKERARHALSTWGRLAHKVTAAVLPVEEGASPNEVTRAVLMAMDENGFSRATPLVLSLDQCCSALASNTRSSKNTHWVEFALALALAPIVARFRCFGLCVVAVVSEFPAHKKDMLIQHAGWSPATHLVAGGASRTPNRAFWVFTNLDDAARRTAGAECPFSCVPGGAKVLFNSSEFDQCGFVLNKNGHKDTPIGDACNWSHNSGGQLGDAGVSANVELPVSFELVKYLLALVGLVGTYDISTEAVTRRALLATTLSEHLGIACSARVGVVREHFCVSGPCGARTDTPRASPAPSPSVSGRCKTAAPFRRFPRAARRTARTTSSSACTARTRSSLARNSRPSPSPTATECSLLSLFLSRPLVGALGRRGSSRHKSSSFFPLFYLFMKTSQ